MTLDRTFSQLVLAMAPRFDARAVAPETFADINRAYDPAAPIIVWQGASERTIFGCPKINHAFRAWHDWRHIAGQHDFTLAGEIATMRAQQHALIAAHGDNVYTRHCARIIACEVQGQAEHFARTGAFPVDELQFAKEYLSCA
jgi:hypothetical protein